MALLTFKSNESSIAINIIKNNKVLVGEYWKSRFANESKKRRICVITNRWNQWPVTGHTKNLNYQVLSKIPLLKC